MAMTRTCTCWWRATTCAGSEIRRLAISDMCMSPSLWTPKSTNAPKLEMLVTIPGSTMPTCRSSMVWTCSAKWNSSNCCLGSRLGFSNSWRMSISVGSPISLEMYFSGLILLRRVLSFSKSATVQPKSRAICSTTGYASGCTAELSSGMSESVTRRKPADCSKVFAPIFGTRSSALRLGKAPLAAR